MAGHTTPPDPGGKWPLAPAGRARGWAGGGERGRVLLLSQTAGLKQKTTVQSPRVLWDARVAAPHTVHRSRNGLRIGPQSMGDDLEPRKRIRTQEPCPGLKGACVRPTTCQQHQILFNCPTMLRPIDIDSDGSRHRPRETDLASLQQHCRMSNDVGSDNG